MTRSVGTARGYADLPQRRKEFFFSYWLTRVSSSSYRLGTSESRCSDRFQSDTSTRRWRRRSVHEAQLLTYLRLTNSPAGLLMNFTVAKLADGVTRRMNARKVGPDGNE